MLELQFWLARKSGGTRFSTDADFGVCLRGEYPESSSASNSPNRCFRGLSHHLFAPTILSYFGLISAKVSPNRIKSVDYVTSSSKEFCGATDPVEPILIQDSL